MHCKLLQLYSLPGETSKLIANFCKDSLCNLDVYASKCVGYCGDSTNTNSGGCLRQGKNNVFTKLKANFNENLGGIGCPMQNLYNAMQSASDMLSVDVEVIVVKLNHFSSYAVRNNCLIEFCCHPFTLKNWLAFFSKCNGKNPEIV